MFWSKNLNIFAQDIQNQSVREAFQTKKLENFGPGPNRGVQNNDSFSSYEDQKHKTLSINMAKYTIILTDFVPIFFISNLFQILIRG